MVTKIYLPPFLTDSRESSDISDKTFFLSFAPSHLLHQKTLFTKKKLEKKFTICFIFQKNFFHQKPYFLPNLTFLTKKKFFTKKLLPQKNFFSKKKNILSENNISLKLFFINKISLIKMSPNALFHQNFFFPKRFFTKQFFQQNTFFLIECLQDFFFFFYFFSTK